MKENKIEKRADRRGVLAVLGIIGVTAVCIALAVGYSKLRGLWLEQCVITDVSAQVSITDGKMVRADVIASEFGLRNGANLALIDFKGRRADVLKRIPNIRDISIARHLPDRVTLTVEERTPVVRLGIKGSRRDDGHVADSDGVVFVCSRGTQTLPLILESAAPGTAPGRALSGHALAALRLIETCRDQFRELGLIEVDVSKPDYLVLGLSGTEYSIAKIAWDGMDDPSPATQKNLETQLKNLSKTISSNIGRGIRVWNATLPGLVTADTQKGFL